MNRKTEVIENKEVWRKTRRCVLVLTHPLVLFIVYLKAFSLIPSPSSLNRFI